MLTLFLIITVKNLCIHCKTSFNSITDQGTAHSLIFSLTNLGFDAIPQTKKNQTQYFSFSNSNTDNLLNILIDNHNAFIGSEPDCPNFNSFLDTFSNAIDKTCNFLIPKSTIRNAINNPRITDSVIKLY